MKHVSIVFIGGILICLFFIITLFHITTSKVKQSNEVVPSPKPETSESLKPLNTSTGCTTETFMKSVDGILQTEELELTQAFKENITAKIVASDSEEMIDDVTLVSFGKKNVLFRNVAGMKSDWNIFNLQTGMTRNIYYYAEPIAAAKTSLLLLDENKVLLYKLDSDVFEALPESVLSGDERYSSNTDDSGPYLEPQYKIENNILTITVFHWEKSDFRYTATKSREITIDLNSR